MVLFFNNILAIAHIYLFIKCTDARLFYRVRGYQSFGERIKVISNLRRSEDCINHCYSTEHCLSFNTFEVKERKSVTCELLSVDLCDLNGEDELQKRGGTTSVYFSSKREECVSLHVYESDFDMNMCVVQSYRKPYVDDFEAHFTKSSPCAGFTFKKGKLYQGNRCMTYSNAKWGTFEMRPVHNREGCLSIEIDQSDFIIFKPHFKKDKSERCVYKRAVGKEKNIFTLSARTDACHDVNIKLQIRRDLLPDW